MWKPTSGIAADQFAGLGAKLQPAPMRVTACAMILIAVTRRAKPLAGILLARLDTNRYIESGHPNIASGGMRGPGILPPK
jgi:hypothetical protein